METPVRAWSPKVDLHNVLRAANTSTKENDETIVHLIVDCLTEEQNMANRPHLYCDPAVSHGELCPESYNYYCLNGGTCYILVSTPFCWCNNSFKGNRCEEFLLPSHQPKRTVSSLLITIIVVTLLIGVLVISVRTYFYCRKWRQKRRKERGRSLYQLVARHRDKGPGATKYEQDCQHI